MQTSVLKRRFRGERTRPLLVLACGEQMAFVRGELLGPFPFLLAVEEFARLDDLAGGGVELVRALIEKFPAASWPTLRSP